MKKVISFFVVVVVFFLALNIQWHYDRMCASALSPKAYFKLDGVYCVVPVFNRVGVEVKLNFLLERQKNLQQLIECRQANLDKEYLCDPSYIPSEKYKWMSG